MKSIFLKSASFLFFLAPLSSHALSLTLFDQQGLEVFSSSISSAFVGQSLGRTTVQVFQSRPVLYTGDESYMRSINGVGSNTVGTKAYGWCFTLNGVAPTKNGVGLSAGEAKIGSASDEILWFYGYFDTSNSDPRATCQPTSAAVQNANLSIQARHPKAGL